MSKRESEPGLGGVQAIALTTFASQKGDLLPFCRYLLLRVKEGEAAKAREWIARLLAAGLVKSVNEARITGDRANRLEGVGEAACIAFSFGGLQALGLREEPDFPFPTPFRTGMASPLRAPLLGDNNHGNWAWGDVAPGTEKPRSGPEVDILVAHFRKRDFDDTDGLLAPGSLGSHGLALQRMVETCPNYIESGTEPFGFRDGLSQPRIRGLQAGAKPDAKAGSPGSETDRNLVQPGEFILGHRNEFGERAYCPDVIGWKAFSKVDGTRFARDGSYLAVRQIEQHLEEFRKFETDPKHAVAQGHPTFAEKIIGRGKKGVPLGHGPVAAGANPAELDFAFRVGDAEGFQCPRGSHIRRANPRDMLGWDVGSGIAISKLHRLLRRGRVYRDAPTCGDPGKASCRTSDKPEDCGKGLFFIALNADLDRQFEFVQQRWIASSKFADLWNESDPALGAGASREFSIPGCAPIGRRLTGLPQFTTVKGGGYFFLPSLRALEFIADGSGAK
jgi:putative iron-dependent peroxidase